MESGAVPDSCCQRRVGLCHERVTVEVDDTAERVLYESADDSALANGVARGAREEVGIGLTDPVDELRIALVELGDELQVPGSAAPVDAVALDIDTPVVGIVKWTR